MCAYPHLCCMVYEWKLGGIQEEESITLKANVWLLKMEERLKKKIEGYSVEFSKNSPCLRQVRHELITFFVTILFKNILRSN